MVELGESLNQLLTGLEDLGMDAAIPTDMEIDLRHAMNLVDIGDSAAATAFTVTSPGINRKSILRTRSIDDIDDGNEADDDMTEEFLSTTSPYGGLLQEECERQVAQLLQGELLKSGSRSALLMKTEDHGDDTDADVEVIDEEEMSNFVDFLQFATSGDFRECVEGSPKSGSDFLQFAALASAAVGNVPPGTSSITNTQQLEKDGYINSDLCRKDDAFSMLPVELTLQDPPNVDEFYDRNQEVSDVERIFLCATSPLACKNVDRKQTISKKEEPLREPQYMPAQQ